LLAHKLWPYYYSNALKMKTITCAIITTALLLFSCGDSVNAWKMVRRNLGLHGDDDEYAFLVSHIRDDEDWCITATNGVGEGASLGFRRCNFDDAPDRQLWHFMNGKFHSKRNHNRCITVDYGNHISVGTWVRMHDCDMDTDLNEFLHNGETDKIVVKHDRRYCVTNRGNNPDSSDNIVVDKCKNNGKYLFTYRIKDEGHDDYFGLNNDSSENGGCLVIKDENPVSGQPLILGNCDLNHDWRYDSHGLFHSALDDDMCMQLGRNNEQIKLGTAMRLYPCDQNNQKQQFDYNRIDIRPRGYNNMCIGFRGNTGNVDVDPIVLRHCKDGSNWSQD